MGGGKLPLRAQQERAGPRERSRPCGRRGAFQPAASTSLPLERSRPLGGRAGRGLSSAWPLSLSPSLAPEDDCLSPAPPPTMAAASRASPCCCRSSPGKGGGGGRQRLQSLGARGCVRLRSGRKSCAVGLTSGLSTLAVRTGRGARPRGRQRVLPGAARLQVEYQRFLTELSERPGRFFAISAHRVPSFACICRMIWSSSAVHAPFLSVGSRLLHHLWTRWIIMRCCAIMRA